MTLLFKPISFFIYMKLVQGFLVLLIFSMALTPAYAEIIQLITKNGNIINVEVPRSQTTSNSGTGNGSSIIDGLGTNVVMDTISLDGRVFYGSTQDGKETVMRPYVGIDPDANYVGVVSNSDAVITMTVPEFGAEYAYQSGTLGQVTNTKPNILGFSEKRSIGSVTSVLSDAGITVSGSGTVLFKLAGMSDQTIWMKGTVPIGSDVKIVTTTNDLVNAPYDQSYGFNIQDGSGSVGNGDFMVPVPSRGAGAAYLYVNVLYDQSFSFDSLLSEQGLQYAVYSYLGQHTTPSYSGCWVAWAGGPRHVYCPEYLSGSVSSSSISSSQSLSLQSKTPSLNGLTTAVWSGSFPHISGSGTVHIYDTTGGPVTNQHTENFENAQTFPLTQSYLIVKPNNNSVIVKGEAFSNAVPLFHVTGLPSLVPFEMSKQGIVGVRGITSATGEILLLPGQVDFGTVSTQGGILKIYPDSLAYEGSFGSHLFDTINNGQMDISFGDDLAYIPPAYMRVSFPVAVSVEDVRLDNTQIPYLIGNYSKSQSLMIPVIPGTQEIHMTLNGAKAAIQISDIQATGNVKAIPEKSSASSDFGLDDSSITSSDTQSSVSFIASKTGKVTVIISGSVSGTAEFTMNSQYTGPVKTVSSCSTHGASSPYQSHSCSSGVVAVNQGAVSNMNALTAQHQTNLIDAINDGNVATLDVYVDVFKNGILVGDPIKIYESTSASVSPGSSLFAGNGRFSAGYTISVAYPQEQFSKVIETPVDLADFMEFVVRANLEARGIPAPNDNDANEFSSYAKSTAMFHGGSIITGMN